MILVTGGLGFIGLHTARALIDEGEQVVLTQYRVPREPGFIKGEIGKNAFIEQLDVTDAGRLAEIGRKHRITGIVHLAVPGLGALSAAEDYNVNMTGLINILEAGREWECKRIGLASSQAIYAGVQQGPFKEDMPLRIMGQSPTETFKKSFEILGTHYAQRTGAEVVMLRIGGIYGPLYHSMANLASRLVHAAVNGEAPTMRGETFAEDGGDICYVKDCGKGVALLMTADKLTYRCYNVGTGQATKNKELVGAIQKQVPDFKVDLKEGAGPSNRPNSFMDISRIQEDTSYKPQFLVEKSIPDYVGWLRAGNAE
ncbi:MAG: NAD-dependent epimerase/dehydratase family protein [Dehalococcoidia bacterium]|nr:NAD-dependent epimerase/dehydratase family protein [Dehalococcoidia bacterium]